MNVVRENILKVSLNFKGIRLVFTSYRRKSKFLAKIKGYRLKRLYINIRFYLVFIN